MDLIFPQPGRVALVMPATAFPVGPPPALAQPDRIDLLASLTPEDKTAGLVWVALHAPATYDAMLDALEADARDDAAAVSEEPEPYCLSCDLLTELPIIAAGQETEQSQRQAIMLSEIS